MFPQTSRFRGLIVSGWNIHNGFCMQVEVYARTMGAKWKRDKFETLRDASPQILEYIRYCSELGLDGEPDYNYLRNLFTTLMNEKGDLVDRNSLNFVYKLPLTNVYPSSMIVRQVARYNLRFK